MSYLRNYLSTGGMKEKRAVIKAIGYWHIMEQAWQWLTLAEKCVNFSC